MDSNLALTLTKYRVRIKDRRDPSKEYEEHIVLTNFHGKDELAHQKVIKSKYENFGYEVTLLRPYEGLSQSRTVNIDLNKLYDAADK